MIGIVTSPPLAPGVSTLLTAAPKLAATRSCLAKHSTCVPPSTYSMLSRSLDTHSINVVHMYYQKCLRAKVLLKLGKRFETLVLAFVWGGLEHLPHLRHIVHQHVFNAAFERHRRRWASRARTLQHTGGENHVVYTSSGCLPAS